MKVWTDVGDAGMQAGSTRLVKVEHGQVLVGRLVDGELFAVDNACPHEGYPLAKGDLSACVLTCRWHNFRFDVRTGKALLGDEAVRTYGVREVAGRLELDLAEPDPEALITRHTEALAEAVHDGRLGQAAREAARLLRLGVSGRTLLVELARLDADFSEYGASHVLPLATDLAELLPQELDVRETLGLVHTLSELTTRSIERRTRHVVRPVGGSIQALRAAVEAEEVEPAIALAVGLSTQDPEGLFEALVGVCADHFLGFGHGLIYTVKLRELGGMDDPSLVAGLTRRLVNATREDLLPDWSRFRRGLEAWDGAESPTVDGPDRDLDCPPAEALDAALAYLREGRSEALLTALIRLACGRVERFDASLDADPSIQNGWLDVTHILTFADAVSQVAPGRDRDRLLCQLTWFAARHRVLDGVNPPVVVARETVVDEVRAVAMGPTYRQPIVVAHLFKTAAAVERLMGRPGVGDAPLRALTRLADTPIHERFALGQVEDAIRFVFEGKVPRSRT